MTEENKKAPKEPRFQRKGKYDIIDFITTILAIILVGEIVVIAMIFFAPTIGDVNSYGYFEEDSMWVPDFSATETQEVLDCHCNMRSDAWLNRVWWDGLPEGKLVVIAPKTIVYGEPYQTIAFAYSPKKFSNDEIDEQVQSFLQRLNLSEDTAYITITEIFLDTWGYPRLTNFRIDRIPDYIDPENVTVWIMEEYKHGSNVGLEGLYTFELRFEYDENYSESSKCRRICTGDSNSNWAPYVYEQMVLEHIPLSWTSEYPLSEYPLVEDFNSSEDFISTDPDLYISDGNVHWKVTEGEGVQYIYRTIPPFSGNVKLTVTGQIDGYTGKCEVRVGIGDGIPELGESIHESGISIHFSFVGESCPEQQDPLVRASGVDIYDIHCSKSGAMWVHAGHPITVSLWVSRYADLFLEEGPHDDISLIGLGGYIKYNGEYNTLFVGLTGNQDEASCWGTIDSVVIEPLNDE